MNLNNNKPGWLDQSLYPFKSKYIQLDTGQMHYVDEGHGDILLFVHGTPTWSFLYRDFIKVLSKQYRCIAIDHLGFGLSENPKGFSGTPQAHANNLSEFITKKDLYNITLIVHDFGGPIGLSAGIANANRINKIVLFNSWLWETKHNKDAQKIDKLINSWLGRFLYLNMNFSPKVLLKKGLSNTSLLSDNVHQHYIKPFPNKQSRIPLLNIAKALVGASAWYQEQWQQLDALTNKEWLVLWGEKDEFISPRYLKRWLERLPNAQVKTYGSGHFIQEEKGKEAILEIQNFVGKSIQEPDS